MNPNFSVVFVIVFGDPIVGWLVPGLRHRPGLRDCSTNPGFERSRYSRLCIPCGCSGSRSCSTPVEKPGCKRRAPSARKSQKPLPVLHRPQRKSVASCHVDGESSAPNRDHRGGSPHAKRGRIVEPFLDLRIDLADNNSNQKPFPALEISGPRGYWISRALESRPEGSERRCLSRYRFCSRRTSSGTVLGAHRIASRGVRLYIALEFVTGRGTDR